MHADDMAARGIQHLRLVDVTSHFRGETRSVKHFQAIEYPIARGCAATYFPEGNPLVPLDDVARGSCQPAPKSIVITVTPSVDRAA